jgi:hypothetical protein
MGQRPMAAEAGVWLGRRPPGVMKARASETRAHHVRMAVVAPGPRASEASVR